MLTSVLLLVLSASAPQPPQLKLQDLRPKRALGYLRGRRRPITVVEVQPGAWLEVEAALAFVGLWRAAQSDGITFIATSAFRTQRKQRWLYRCFKQCSCNGCRPAARPGWSRHQTGRAIDVSISGPQAERWLKKNARRFGFRRPVKGEPWHLEFVR